MKEEIAGISNISAPVIKNILPIQLQKYNIKLQFISSLGSEPYVHFDFALIDGERFLSKDRESFLIQEAIKDRKPVYAVITKRDYRIKLELLKYNILECFEYPIMTDILCKTMRNQLEYYLNKLPQQRHLEDSGIVYSVQNTPFNDKVNLEFLPAKGEKWFLRYAQRAAYISRFEKRIIEYLLSSKKVVTKNELAFIAWHTFEVKNNTIAVTIKKIRDLLNELGVPVTIKNLYGYGYSLSNL